MAWLCFVKLARWAQLGVWASCPPEGPPSRSCDLLCYEAQDENNGHSCWLCPKFPEYIAPRPDQITPLEASVAAQYPKSSPYHSWACTISRALAHTLSGLPLEQADHPSFLGGASSLPPLGLLWSALPKML